MVEIFGKDLCGVSGADGGAVSPLESVAIVAGVCGVVAADMLQI